MSRDLSLSRLYFTLKYHQPQQLFRRIVNRSKRRFSGLVSAPNDISKRAGVDNTLDELLRVRLVDVEQESHFSGHLRFLGKGIQLGDPPDWSIQGPGVDHLWIFNLHYHEFLLRYLQDEPLLSRLIRSWIENYDFATASHRNNGWHPFCISRRLAVWTLLISRCDLLAESQLVLSSVWRQAEYLSRSLETDIGGNHLLENARALAFASLILDVPDSTKWIEIVADVVRTEIPKQVLDHGEHFERATTYHVEVWHLFAELSLILSENDAPTAKACAAVANTMAEFVEVLRCPDGTLPLFGDSTKVARSRIDAIRTMSKSAIEKRKSGREVTRDRQSRVLSVKGDYAIWRNTDNYLVFDAADAGPDHLPAHMHADLLGVELWIGGVPLAVDPGVFDYSDSKMRRYCRSSLAHSVMEVDATDQFDMWSRFRVGYRGHTSGLVTGEQLGCEWAESTHNAYRRIGVNEVGRRIYALPSRSWACVDWAAGHATPGRTLRSRLHLHPAVETSRAANSVRLSVGKNDFVLHCFGGQLTCETGYYCPQMGVREATTVLVIEAAEAALPAAIGWYLRPNSHSSSLNFEANSDEFRLAIDDCVFLRRF